MKKTNYTKEEKANYFNEVKSTMKELEEKVNSIETEEEYKRHLQIISQFNNYSYYNRMLLNCQDASYVCSYKQWQEKGRQVKKGSKALKILAPVFKKKTVEKEIVYDNQKETIQEEKKYMYFMFVPVFDISQTEGEEIEGLGFGMRIKENTENANTLFNNFKSIIEKQIPVYFENTESANGYTDYSKIVLNTILTDNEKISTLIHELAHNLLNHKERKNVSREIKELEAESVAYVVLTKLGQPTKAIEYLKAWVNNKEFKMQTILNEVCKASDKIVEMLEI